MFAARALAHILVECMPSQCICPASIKGTHAFPSVDTASDKLFLRQSETA